LVKSLKTSKNVQVQSWVQSVWCNLAKFSAEACFTNETVRQALVAALTESPTSDLFEAWYYMSKVVMPEHERGRTELKMARCFADKSSREALTAALSIGEKRDTTKYTERDDPRPGWISKVWLSIVEINAGPCFLDPVVLAALTKHKDSKNADMSRRMKTIWKLLAKAEDDIAEEAEESEEAKADESGDDESDAKAPGKQLASLYCPGSEFVCGFSSSRTFVFV
jgi:hypothetical protein